MKPSKPCCVLVDLDSLLDTRLTTLAKLIDKEQLEEYCKLNYFKREDDKFFNLSIEQFNDHYSKRDKSNLFNAKVTYVKNAVNDIIVESIRDIGYTPFMTTKFKVYLNIYPYKLDDDEIIILGRVINHITSNFAEFEIVSWSDQELTPDIILKESINHIFKYSWGSWLDTQHDKIKACPIPHCSLYIPYIYGKGKPTQQELEDNDCKTISPFRKLEIGMSTYIQVLTVPAYIYSVALYPLKELQSKIHN